MGKRKTTEELIDELLEFNHKDAARRLKELAAEVARLQMADSYDEGYREGLDDGRSDGYDDGYEAGHDNGYAQGLEAGRDWN